MEKFFERLPDGHRKPRWERWRLLFKVDVMSVVFLVVILLLVGLWVLSMQQCNSILDEPLAFCAEFDCCPCSELPVDLSSGEWLNDSEPVKNFSWEES